ncbi:ApeP family dehydratase [Acinetobacter rudis]|uniref:ApeP family dehydratase n=1 Tax=Acinetobacter rudis TaxID=632955 RepID=UPI0033400CCF
MFNAIDFIPHAEPMVFVDHIVEVGEQYIITELCIRPELMFCDETGLPSWTSIEIMAQSISAFAGYKGHLHGRAPQIGFLLGTRKLHLPVSHFALGQRLRIRAEQSYLHDGLAQFDCEIDYAGQKITATLNVFEPTSAQPDVAQ